MRTILQVGLTALVGVYLVVIMWPLRGTWARTDVTLWRVMYYLCTVLTGIFVVVAFVDNPTWFFIAGLFVVATLFNLEGLNAAKAHRRWFPPTEEVSLYE